MPSVVDLTGRKVNRYKLNAKRNEYLYEARALGKMIENVM